MIFLQLFFGFFIQVMPFAIIAIYPCTKHLRFSAKKTIWMTLCFVAALGCIFSVISYIFYTRFTNTSDLNSAVNIVFLCCVTLCFLYFSYVVRITWREKLFIFSFLLISALTLTSFCNAIISWFYKDSYHNGLPYNGISSLIILASNMAVLPPLVLLLEREYMMISDSLSKKENGYLSFLSLALFFILGSGLIFIDYNNVYNPMTIFLLIALFLMVFFIYFIFFRMLHLAHEKFKAQQDNLNLQHQLEIRSEQYLRFNENIEGSRRMRHDLRHHMLIINGYITTGSYEMAKEYLNQRIHDVDSYEITKISNIPIIDWIVNYYHAQAEENHVQFIMHIAPLPQETDSIPAADLAVLLGNLLENALTAASNPCAGGGYIELNIRCFGKMLAITIDNSFDGTVKKDGAKYISTKKDHTGIGLQSIKMITEKYGGGVEFSNDAAVFHSSAMLNISQLEPYA